MANNQLKIAVILGAVDNMSKVINSAVNESVKKLSEVNRSMSNISRGALGAGMMTAGANLAEQALKPIQAFAELEKAQLSLESVMMRAGGKTDQALLAQLNEEAIKLGNLLPGTTADMNQMFITLIQNGVKAQDIAGGLGKAAAYFAVDMGVGYEEGAQMAARLSNNLKIASGDMYAFMDVIARTRNLGVNPMEITYAFSKASGAINLLELNNIQSAKELSAVYAQLITKAGFTGETAGTAFQNVLFEMMNPEKLGAMTAAAHQFGIKDFAFFDAQGKFGGIQNMIAQLDKLKGLTAQQQKSILENVAGPEGKDLSLLLNLTNQGAEGFNAMSQAMADQATLNDKVGVKLKGLGALWEATSGTMTNTAATLGESLEPEMKKSVQVMGELNEGLQNFLKDHPQLTKFLAIAAGLTVVLLVCGGAVLTLSAAMSVLGGAGALGAATGGVAGLTGALGALAATVGPILAVAVALGYVATEFANINDTSKTPVLSNMLPFIFGWETSGMSDEEFRKQHEATKHRDLFHLLGIQRDYSAPGLAFKKAIDAQPEIRNTENTPVSRQNTSGNVTFAPTINVDGKTDMKKEDFEGLFGDLQKQFEKFITDRNSNIARLSF
jgi:TP901 family phage tail tape measure protein